MLRRRSILLFIHSFPFIYVRRSFRGRQGRQFKQVECLAVGCAGSYRCSGSYLLCLSDHIVIPPITRISYRMNIIFKKISGKNLKIYITNIGAKTSETLWENRRRLKHRMS
jgi:hypothetical protein